MAKSTQSNERKKPGKQSAGVSSGERPRDKQGRPTTGSIARTRRIVAIVGNLVGLLALVVAAGAVFWLLTLTAGDNSISSVFEDDVAGTTTIAFPFLMALLSLAGFMFGQFAVRGKWGTSGDARSSGGTFTVNLRPLSIGVHALLFIVAVIAWALVMVLPLTLDAQGAISASDGSSAVEQYWFTVTVYGAVTGALAAAVGVSLIKKLTYNAFLRRNASSIQEGSPSQKWWRAYSHIWRAELGTAALGGAALGLAPLGFRLDSLTYGLSFAGVGIVLLAAAIALALNAWRSGLPVERVESYT